MIKPLSDHVVIEPQKEEKKKGGIILPETAEKERSEKGKVVAVGPGKFDSSAPSTGSGQARRVPMEVKKGDIVLFTKYGPQEVKVDGKDYLIVRQEDILAIIQ